MGVQFQAIASVAPPLIADLGLSYAQLGTLFGLYMLPGVLFALPSGVLGQRFGERRVVVASLALMALGSLVTAASSGFAVAAIGRVASGAGAVFMNTLLSKMVADWFTGRELSSAMAVMLSAWPVGLGLATATLGGLADLASWRVAVGATALLPVLGLALIVLAYRDAPGAGVGNPPSASRGRLRHHELGLAVTSGLAWGLFNASLVTVVGFGPALLVARGASLGDAGFIVSLAVWITIVTVPLGGVLNDWLHRPNLMIIGGSFAAGCATASLPQLSHPVMGFILLGVLVGAPPGAVMALLPAAFAPERLATGLGVYYSVFYAAMALAQPVAGLVRDLSGDPARPILFAAVLMTGTVIGLSAFRALERTTIRD